MGVWRPSEGWTVSDMPPVQYATWGQPLLAQMLLRVAVASAFHGQGLSPFVAAHTSV